MYRVSSVNQKHRRIPTKRKTKKNKEISKCVITTSCFNGHKQTESPRLFHILLLQVSRCRHRCRCCCCCCHRRHRRQHRCRRLAWSHIVETVHDTIFYTIHTITMGIHSIARFWKYEYIFRICVGDRCVFVCKCIVYTFLL